MRATIFRGGRGPGSQGAAYTSEIPRRDPIPLFATFAVDVELIQDFYEPMLGGLRGCRLGTYVSKYWDGQRFMK